MPVDQETWKKFQGGFNKATHANVSDEDKEDYTKKLRRKFAEASLGKEAEAGDSGKKGLMKNAEY